MWISTTCTRCRDVGPPSAELIQRVAFPPPSHSRKGEWSMNLFEGDLEISLLLFYVTIMNLLISLSYLH